MSTLQNRAKPIVLRLIQGDRVILGAEEQKIVAAWCAMSVMTSDFFNPTRQAVPQAHRDYFRASLLPPSDTWKIWLGFYERKNWLPHWVKNSMPVSYDDGDIATEIADDGVPMPNTQSTTLIFGKLYVHAFSSVFPSLVAKPWITGQGDGVEKFVQLWPIRDQFTAWPINPIGDRDADTYAGAIFRTLDNVARS
jgi:hypothetical protein